jgi:hypothetical protein
MPDSRFLGLVCCLWWLAVAQATSVAAQRPESLGDVWLEGTVGSAAVRAYVGDAGYPKEDGLWGMYYYTKYWLPLTLEGGWTSPGQVRLTEGDPGNARAKPRFDLKMSQSPLVEGTWTSADGQQVLPVKLRRVPKPPPFEVAIRRARRFEHPKWPITLSYPAGWRLDASDGKLTLRSPDPEDMLFRNELDCVRGTGLPAPPRSGEPPVEFEWPFFRGESGWLAGTGLSGECESDTCKPPESRQAGAGVFMKASMAYRSHGPWGYWGLAEASAYLVVVDDEWARCSDRLLDADTRIRVVGSGRRP